jgi:hypothetical protein
MSTGLLNILNFIDNICENYERNEIAVQQQPSENIDGIRNIRRFLSIRNINGDYDNNRFILSNIFKKPDNQAENPVANIMSSFLTNYINNISIDNNVNNIDNNVNNIDNNVNNIDNNIDNNVNNIDNNIDNNVNNIDNKDNTDNTDMINLCSYSELDESVKNNIDNNDNCSICFEKLTDDILGVTKCNHIYHHNCIKQWLINNKTCPLCRTSI